MPLINGSIPSLFNGVSQQPASLRLDSQCELQENGLSALVDGMKKRPPLQHIAKLRTGLNANLYNHFINRDVNERYTVLIENNSIEVYDLAGTAKTVNYADATWFSLEQIVATATGGKRQVYLPTGTTTITLKTTGITTATIIWEQSATGEFGGEETTVRTDTVDTDASVSWTSGYWIRARCSAWTAGTIDAEVTAKDTTYLKSTTPRDDFTAITVADYTFIVNKTVTVELDTITRIGSVLSQVQDFASLPGTPATGDIHEVTGDPTIQTDSFYVIYTGSVWAETDKPGEKFRHNKGSMPHQLVRQADGTFLYGEVAYDVRDCGDVNTNPPPSFTDRKITDVFFHKNRLGFLADENIVLSESGSFFNFWRDTVTTSLDTDRIDQGGTHTKVSKLQWAVPFDDALLLFSEQTQFTFQSTTAVLNQKSAEITPTTEFEASIKMKPIGVGTTAYFAIERGDYAGLREYFVEASSAASKDAADITAHVPKYIPKNLFHAAASSNEDIVMVLSLDKRYEVYVYKFYWGGENNSKLQSSWSTWIFPSTWTILGMHFINTVAYFVIQRSDGIFLEKMQLESGVKTGAFPFDVLLDRRVELTGSYDAGNNWTTWTLPYAVNTDQTTDGEVQAILGTSWTGREGELLTVTRPSTTTFRVAGEDLSANSVYAGIKYTMRYRFSRQYYRDASKNAIVNGRLQLKTLTVNFTDTGFFKIEITPKARDKNTYTYNSWELGDVNTTIGDIVIKQGKKRVPVLTKAADVVMDIVNDSFLPSVFQSAEWEGHFHARARRV